MPLLKYRRIDQGDATILRLEGKLDAVTTPELAPVIDQLFDDRRTDVTLDLGSLDVIDPTGFAALVQLAKRIRAIEGKVKVSNLQGQPLALFDRAGNDRLFVR